MAEGLTKAQQAAGQEAVKADTLHELQEHYRELLRTISHDLRSPLTVIQGRAQLLLRAVERAGLTGRERSDVEDIIENAQRMNAMIQDLVDSARLEAGLLELHPEPIDLRAFACQLSEQLPEPGEGKRIRVMAADGLPRALADPDRLARILSALLAAAGVRAGPAEVTVSVAAEDARVVLAVAGQGSGLPPAEVERLFQRHWGAGDELASGLQLARMLAEAQGGHLWAESEPGEGIAFILSLPAAR